MTKPKSVRWHKSSRSNDEGACVELAALPGETIGIRDSKNPDAARLVLRSAEFRDLITRTKAGAFDL